MAKVRHSLTLVLTLALVTAACSGDGAASPFGDSDTTPPSSSASSTTSGGDTTTTEGSGGATSTTAGDSGGGDSTTTTTAGSTATTAPPDETTTTTAAADPDVAVRPLPVMEGLATFDSFEWTMRVITVGPTADEFSDISTTLHANRAGDQRRTTITSTQNGPDYDEPETSVQETWQDPEATCSYDGFEYSLEVINSQQREILDVALGMFDIQVIPESGRQIGQEQIAGVPATHYRYTISGLGKDSGAVATENQVDYWVANDTGALVKYSLVAETRSGPTSDPTAEIYRVEAAAELQMANAEADVAFPPECEALRPTETVPVEVEAGSRVVINVGGESVGVLSVEPVCTVTGNAQNQEITAVAAGRVGGTRYRLTVVAQGVSGDGDSPGTFELITGVGDNRTAASGEGTVTSTFLDGGFVSLAFNSLLEGADQRTRVRGTVTCPTG